MIRALGAWLLTAASGCQTAHAEPWDHGAAVYEILVRSFQDSNGDGVGDLEGVRQRLPYLQDLGVGALWLLPIYPSPSYHGYDITDYQAVNPAYGTIDTFKALVADAHAHGIKIVLDIALNHTSSKHPWFKQHARYVWRDTIPDWSAISDNVKHWHQVGNPYYYAFFSPSMPDLDWTNADVYTDVAAALKFWVQLGVDGFRLDAARYLVEGPKGESDTKGTHQIWQRLVAATKAVNPDTLFVGEVWADQNTIDAYHGGGKELDEAFGFPVSFGLVAALKSGNPVDFVAALQRQASSPAFFSAPFLTNHDQVRIATELAGDQPRLTLAAASLLTLPGTPYLYYGEEIGLPNGKQSGDLAKRTPMPWDATQGTNRGFTTGKAPWEAFATDDPGIDVAAQQAAPASLFKTYRQLLALRRADPALIDGNLAVVASPVASAAAFIRALPDETVLVVLNFGAASSKAATFTIDWSGDAPAVQTLYGGVQATAQSDGTKARVTLPSLPAHAAVILKL